MKKHPGLILLALALMLPVLALASSDHCADHPNAGRYTASGVDCKPRDESCHLASYWEYEYCSECNKQISPSACIYTEQYEPHVFLNDKCTLCGYLLVSTPTPQPETPVPATPTAAPTATPTPAPTAVPTAAPTAEPTAEIDAVARITASGNVRASASAGAAIVGTVYAGESYRVVNTTTTNGSTWLEIEFNAGRAWISGSLAEVLSSDDNSGSASQQLIGRTIVVKVGSGNARVSPGSSSGKVGIVTKGQQYTILDCGYDQSNQLWYKIKLNQSYAWISSGIVNLH